MIGVPLSSRDVWSDCFCTSKSDASAVHWREGWNVQGDPDATAKQSPSIGVQLEPLKSVSDRGKPILLISLVGSQVCRSKYHGVDLQ